MPSPAFQADLGSREQRDDRVPADDPFMGAILAHPLWSTAAVVSPSERLPDLLGTAPLTRADLRAAIQAKHEQDAARDGGWTVAPVVYRMPTDVLDLVDAVAIYQARGYEVVTKGTPGDPTLMRVVVRRDAATDATLAEYREALGLDGEEMDDAAEARGAQDRSEWEPA